MPAAAAPIAGAVVGGLMSDDSEQTQTASKEPWAAAAPWIRDNISRGQRLQDYYEQNPFNQIQQAGLQGQLDNYHHQNNAVIPGLLGFANQLMGQNYQRSPSLGMYGGMANMPPGLMSHGGQGMGGQAMGGNPMLSAQGIPQGAQHMIGESPQPMFTPPPSRGGGQIDWNAMNPLYKDPNAVQEPEAQAAPALDIPRYIGSGEMGNYSPEVVAAYIEMLRNREPGYGMPYHVGGDGG